MADDGWYGNPDWATPERADAFVDTVCDEVLERVNMVFAAHTARAERIG